MTTDVLIKVDDLQKHFRDGKIKALDGAMFGDIFGDLFSMSWGF